MQMKFNVPPRRRSSITHYYKYSVNHQLFSRPGGLPWGLNDPDMAPNPKSLHRRARRGARARHCQHLPAWAGRGSSRGSLSSSLLNDSWISMLHLWKILVFSIYKAFTKYLLIWLVMYLSCHFLSACYWLYWADLHLAVTPGAPGSDPSFASHSRQIIQLLQVSISCFVRWKQQ